ncbi:MAG: hypothetical protein JW720_06830 [Sedimentisphaerales bacterium]|nr:hypothetical protein [Sedimentisphaerales bacterium]
MVEMTYAAVDLEKVMPKLIAAPVNPITQTSMATIRKLNDGRFIAAMTAVAASNSNAKPGISHLPTVFTLGAGCKSDFDSTLDINTARSIPGEASNKVARAAESLARRAEDMQTPHATGTIRSASTGRLKPKNTNRPVTSRTVITDTIIVVIPS